MRSKGEKKVRDAMQANSVRTWKWIERAESRAQKRKKPMKMQKNEIGVTLPQMMGCPPFQGVGLSSFVKIKR